MKDPGVSTGTAFSDSAGEIITNATDNVVTTSNGEVVTADLVALFQSELDRLGDQVAGVVKGEHRVDTQLNCGEACFSAPAVGDYTLTDEEIVSLLAKINEYGTNINHGQFAKICTEAIDLLTRVLHEMAKDGLNLLKFKGNQEIEVLLGLNHDEDFQAEYREWEKLPLLSSPPDESEAHSTLG